MVTATINQKPLTKSILADSMRAAWARAYVRIVGANRELSWVLTEIILPILSVMTYVFLYRALGAPPLYEGMVILGGAMIPFWMVVLWSMAIQFYWEKETGNLDIFMSSPTDPIALLLGMAIGGLFMGLMRTVLILLIGAALFHVTLSVESWPWLAAIVTLTMTALFALGMSAASVYFITGRKGIKLNIALMEPVFMLTGMYFPLKSLGLILGIFSSLIPISLGLDGIRQLCLPGAKPLGFMAVPAEAAVLLAMTVVFSIASVYFMRRMERKGRRDGTLTEKWQ